jgi:hypothetical protein
MTQRDFQKRPNCEKLLKRKNLWLLDKKKFNFRKISQEFPKPHTFIYFMIDNILSD